MIQHHRHTVKGVHIRQRLPGKYCHKLHVGWELPMPHFRVVAVGEAIDMVHARSESTLYTRNLHTVFMLIPGGENEQTETFTFVTWMGTALSYLLVDCASGLFGRTSTMLVSFAPTSIKHLGTSRVLN